jgi:outer membrane protein OmpA-like peptidoglycan-associated protein
MTNKTHSVIKIGFGFFIPVLMIFAGCGPSQQEMMARDHLANAKAAYAQARANPNVAINAQIPLMDAGRAVDAAEQAREYDEMDHLAYLAEMKTRIAVATAEEQMAENEKKALSRETERLVVQGRGREQIARMEARESNAEARESKAAARESNAEAWSQTQKAEKATDKADKLQQEIAILKGRMTDRGIVLTIGDVLFATGTATLSPMADNEINRLAAFMKEYPDRSVLIEGYTDSTGTEGTNLDLSLNRANAVSNKLVAKGISKSRIATKGFGEESPQDESRTGGLMLLS